MTIQVERLALLVVRDDSDRGQGLAEYALILALIAVVAIVGLVFLGSQLSDKLGTIGESINAVAP